MDFLSQAIVWANAITNAFFLPLLCLWYCLWTGVWIVLQVLSLMYRVTLPLECFHCTENYNMVTLIPPYLKMHFLSSWTYSPGSWVYFYRLSCFVFHRLCAESWFLPDAFFYLPDFFFLSCLLAEVLKQATPYFFWESSLFRLSFNPLPNFEILHCTLCSLFYFPKGKQAQIVACWGGDSFPLVLICTVQPSKGNKMPLFDEAGAPW